MGRYRTSAKKKARQDRESQPSFTVNTLQMRPFAPHQESQVQPQAEEQTAELGHRLENISFQPRPQVNIMARKWEGIRAAYQAKQVQAKLAIGAVGDKYEQEADKVATQVVQTINTPETAQREEEEQVQTKPLESIQRDEAMEEEDEEIQMKPALQRREAVNGGDASEELESSIQQAKGSGQPLDPNLQEKMGQAMGADFSSVKVHTDSQSEQLNQSIQAKAFTTGQDVFFRQGAYNPSSKDGQELIAHELTHVVQQNVGAVQRQDNLEKEELLQSKFAFVQRNGSQEKGLLQRKTPPADMGVARNAIQNALAEHRTDRANLMAYVREGAKSTDRRIANACEWILDGRTKLYALTPTGDSDERLTLAGMDPTEDEAWFPSGDGGAGDLKDKVVTYNPADLEDNTNVNLDEDGKVTNGWNNPGYIAIMLGGGKMSKEQVWQTLVHEVQHDSDKNTVKEAAAVAIDGDTQPNATARAQQFEGFKTEYRAYNYEGGEFDKLSPTKIVKRYGFDWTERQWEIFQQIWDGYEHTQYWWDDSFTNKGMDEPGRLTAKGKYVDMSIGAPWKAAIEARRQALVDYVNPDTEGFNKYDSIRVDDFYKALDSVPKPTSDKTAKEVIALDLKAKALGKPDATYVLKEGVDMKKKMKVHLSGEALKLIFATLRTVSA